MYKVIVFVPTIDKEKVKEAMFACGGGALGDYTHCCFETDGIGQFKPGIGANLHIGSVDIVERVKETKVEMIVKTENITEVLKAMKNAHPYEKVAYDVFKQAEEYF